MAAALDVEVVTATPVHGGDVASAYRVELNDGRRVFVKTHRGPPAGFFTTEAAGLAWLRDARALPVPEVLAVSDGDGHDGRDGDGHDRRGGDGGGGTGIAGEAPAGLAAAKVIRPADRAEPGADAASHAPRSAAVVADTASGGGVGRAGPVGDGDGADGGRLGAGPAGSMLQGSRAARATGANTAHHAFLVLEWIERGVPGASTEAEFGRGLAALHAAGAACFGREDRRTTGSRALPNEPAERWSDFYAENRLLPLARLAHDGGALASRTVDAMERVATRLDDIAAGAAGEPPARLHGDLWAGNRLVDSRGGSWLIDPAAHGGHREFDLAMMRLFGGFGPDCFAAYDEVRPLADGWEDRIALHQIAPLVVHAIKFGGSYGPAAEQAIVRYS